jgi:hypothetical protein
MDHDGTAKLDGDVVRFCVAPDVIAMVQDGS